MRVITRKALRNYWLENPKTKTRLRQWYALTKRANWKTPIDVRNMFPDVDRVSVTSGKMVFIFNVGSAHRLVAAIHFNYPRVYVLRLMDHKEYERNKWRADL